MTPIEKIYNFNKQAGLLDSDYDDFLETSMLVEEAIEGFGQSTNNTTVKEYSRAITQEILHTAITRPNDVDRLDKACDAAIIAIGSIFKLGLTPTQATRALHIVMDHNLAKLGMPKDEYGKLTKPSNFKGPEVELQQLLNERKDTNDTTLT